MAARSNGRFTKAGESKRRVDLSVKMKMLYETDSLLEAESNEPRQLNSCIWIPGERSVFEPYEMDKQLKAGCVDCGLPLQFTNVTEETKCGLGMRYKFDEIKQILLDKIVDCLIFSETKLDSSVKDSLFEVDVYKLQRRDHTDHGGGIATFMRADIPPRRRLDIECKCIREYSC
ncbi:unnamed protein product [Mytilus coruscus]|uniref:Uncharacterized protein n=1 Tax=Mytilus coruscus TaxID=42192 RepID=A0A6J8CA18_MYTCO|nr:unnamed protein product [Mytilus coruscus]